MSEIKRVSYARLRGCSPEFWSGRPVVQAKVRDETERAPNTVVVLGKIMAVPDPLKHYSRDPTAGAAAYRTWR
jgi:hypothetical protein